MARIIKDLARGYNAMVKPSLAQWAAQQRLALGLPPATQTTPLTAEASHRRFYRQTAPGTRALIIMDSPPTLERNQAFIDLANLFAQAGLPVPTILASDLDQGFVAMTDLGSRDLLSAYQAGDQERALAQALHWLLQLQPLRSEHIPPYSAARLADELTIFREWFVEGLLSQPFPAALLQAPFEALVTAADEQRKVCVHRDYHCRNLLLSEDGQFGIVDFQDALHGPLTYDLASLLHDCYHSLPEATVDQWREWFRQRAAPQSDADEFKRQLDWMAVQRQLKAVGIFVRLRVRDGKHSHLPHVLPTLRQLEMLSQRYRALQPLAQWLQDQRTTIAAQLATLQPPSTPAPAA